MTKEIGFYALSSSGRELARVAAVARYLSNSAVYMVDDAESRSVLSYHDITAVPVQCPTPGCVLNAVSVARWISERDPGTLVMDEYAYGRYRDECRGYIRRRRSRTYFLQPSTLPAVSLPDPRDFTAIIGTDPGPVLGYDLHPIVAFNPEEILPRDAARSHYNAGERPLVVMIGSGATPDVNQFVIRACRRAGIDFVIDDSYPTMPYLSAADLVVGYTGQAQVEAETVGATTKAVQSYAAPFQTWRANTDPDDLAQTIADLEVREPWGVEYRNHARQAAALVAGSPNWERVDG